MDPPAPFHPGATRRVRETVRVGVGVVVINNNNSKTIYCGYRKGSHGASKLALPGGHLELYETWEDCAVREVQEEMGLRITNAEFLHVTNDIMKDDQKHYVTIFMVAKQADGDDQIPKNLEPEKCHGGWEAYTLDQLTAMLGTETLFAPLEQLVMDRPAKLLEMLQSE